MPHETNIKKLENGRAEFAYNCVIKAKKPDSTKYKDALASDYKGYVKKMPALIQTNGLGNTLAYILSKGNNSPKEKGNAYNLIYDQLSDWLKSGNSGSASLPEGSDLLGFIISKPSTIYRQFTTEALAFLNWLSRLAAGMIEE